MIIDIFAHYISPTVSKMIKKGKYAKHYRYPAQNDNPEVRSALMNKYKIDIQALSQTTPVLMGFSPTEAAKICQVTNDDNYRQCRVYPDRFVNIGIISLLDTELALRELERCVFNLDCRGITISSNQEGKGLDSPEYYPFYAKLIEYDILG
jgi:aminocarboxymuconate-semialdehyde decarboxylase